VGSEAFSFSFSFSFRGGGGGGVVLAERVVQWWYGGMGLRFVGRWSGHHKYAWSVDSATGGVDQQVSCMAFVCLGSLYLGLCSLETNEAAVVLRA